MRHSFSYRDRLKSSNAEVAPLDEPDAKEWSGWEPRHGWWGGITTWAECLVVERSGRCRYKVCAKKVYPLHFTAEGGQEKCEQFFQ
jgi:hypothetical protein